jgi:predicted phosphodiesterase
LGVRERGADIVMTGHTHVAKIEKRGEAIYLNPGHLKASFDRGQHPSYAIVGIAEDGLEITIHELNGDVRERQRFAR